MIAGNILHHDENNLPKNEKLASIFSKLKILASIITFAVVVPSFFYKSDMFDLASNIFLFVFYIFALIEIYFHYEDSKEHLKSMLLKNMIPAMSLMLIITYAEKYFN